MTGHPDIDVFSRVHAAFTGGDVNTLGALFADDVVWHTPGQNPLTGTYDAVDRFWSR